MGVLCGFTISKDWAPCIIDLKFISLHLDFFKRSNIPLKEKIDDPDEMVNDDISKKDDKDSMKGISF